MIESKSYTYRLPQLVVDCIPRRLNHIEGLIGPVSHNAYVVNLIRADLARSDAENVLFYDLASRPRWFGHRVDVELSAGWSEDDVCARKRVAKLMAQPFGAALAAQLGIGNR